LITFELFPGVSHLFKKQRFPIDFAGGTLSDAFRSLIDLHPHLEDDLLDDDREAIKLTLATFVNDERIPNDALDHHTIEDGDRITILSPISGG
jgi:sulfur carrier protein ThiS